NLRQRPDLNVAGALGVAASPAVFLAHADSAAGTKYLGAADRGAAASSQVVLFAAHSAQSVRYLACTAGTAPGGMVTDRFTVQRSAAQGATWLDTSSSCALTAAAQACFSAATASLGAYDWVAVKIVRDASSSSAAYNCELVVN